MSLVYNCDTCGGELVPGDTFVIVTVRARGNEKQIDNEHVHMECVKALATGSSGLMTRVLAHVLEERTVDLMVQRMGQGRRFLGS